MKNQNYNGFTNYATWRVALELFDGTDEYMSPSHCQNYVECILEEQAGDNLALSYALAFINEVNWYEISESTRDEY